MTFSFLHKGDNETLQFQGFNMAAMISFIYDTSNTSLAVLIKHRFKVEMPILSKSGKQVSTRNVDRDLEYIINRVEDIERFIKLTSPWMTPMEISNLISPTKEEKK